MAATPLAPTSPASASAAVGICTVQDQLREQIAGTLADAGWPVLGECEDLTAAIEVCEENSIELMVFGARRPNVRTLEAIRGLLAALPTVRVVITCDRSAAGDIRKALDAGVHGVVLADQLEVLPLVLSAVWAGQVSVPGSHRKEAGEQILTMREKQVLGLVVMGMTNAQIATKLFLAESTVKSHLSSSFSKLGVASRNEAVGLILDPARGQGLGILTIPADKLAPRQRK